MFKTLIINLADSEKFDDLVHNSLPEAPGGMTVVTKDKVTVGGNPGVVVSFHVQTPDGTIHRVQSVNTLANWRALMGALRGHYGI